MNARRPSRFFGIFPPTPYGRGRRHGVRQAWGQA